MVARSAVFLLFTSILLIAPALDSATIQEQAPRPLDDRARDFDKDLRDQVETDAKWRAASDGYMQMQKITYRTKVGDLDIPAFVFQPLHLRGSKGHPAIVWVHENIRGHLYEHYIPFVREATSKGYVVIAPEYRGSIGYGKPFYDAIDYGGSEVDDVVTAVDVLKAKYPHVDPARVGIMGWSHGGMIALLSIFRNATLFKSAVAIVPVSNLFQRLAWKGVERQRQAIDPHNRYGGLPSERHDVYKDRSPLYNVDKLEIPLLVHVTRNDDDVNIEEDMQLVDALRARKPFLAETKVYDNPRGGHMFDRRVDPKTWQPENTREQRDSWNRVWTFLDWNLDPFHDVNGGVTSMFSVDERGVGSTGKFRVAGGGCSRKRRVHPVGNRNIWLERCVSGNSFGGRNCRRRSFFQAALAVVPHMDRFPNREPGIQDGVYAKVPFPPRQPRRRVVNAADQREAADSGVNAPLEHFSFARSEEPTGCHIVTS